MTESNDDILRRLGEAMADVLVPHQRAFLEREGGSVWLNLDNTKTMRGVRIGPCPGCDECRTEGARHLQFTAYTLKKKEGR